MTLSLPSPLAILDVFSPDNLSPEMVWGLFIRIYGLLFVFAIGQLYPQIQAFAGSDGLFPIIDRLNRIRVDYPNRFERWLRYPTLHWLFNSDRSLKNLLLVGSLSGFILTVIGVHSRLGFAIMWMVYLSFSNMMGLAFPWDCLLLESAFLSLFLPTLSVTQLALPVMPLRLVTFSFRLLLFRLLFGFGKFKFIGASTKEFSYLRGFMINQPMPTIIGWFLYQLPLAVHQFSLFIFFLSEMVAPFFYFATGPWRIGAALITIQLMLVIHTSGNFGFFNVLTSVMSIPVLDGVDTLFADEGLVSMVFSHGWSHMAIHLFLIYLLALALFFFPFNSWCTMSFFLWPGLSLPVNPLGRLLRLMSPFHMVHAFGVFFPHSSAGVRWIPIIEGTADERVNEMVEKDGPELVANSPDSGLVWEEYEYPFMTTRTNRMPPFCAPWHQRIDQAILYESIGMTPETYLSTLSSGNRMEFNPTIGSSMLSRVCSRLLSDHEEISNYFRTNPFPLASASSSTSGSKKKVQALRISYYLFAPTSLLHLWRTGQYWEKRYVGQHNLMMTRRQVEESMTEYRTTHHSKDSRAVVQVREPECGHPEHFIAIADAPAVRQLYQRFDAVLAASSTSIDSSALIAVSSSTASAHAPELSHLVQDITSDQVETLFWHGFMERMKPLVDAVKLPSSSIPTPSKSHHNPSQLDFEFHLQPGQWSRTITHALRSSASPLHNLTGADIHRIEKIQARATLLLLHRLLPLYHGPGADEMTTSAQIHEAMARRGQGKTGVYCIRPCKRDECRVADHLHLPSFFHLYLFTQHLMFQGKSTFDSILLNPSLAAAHVRTFTVASSLVYQGVMHPTMLAVHAAKIRMIVRISFSYQLEQSGILPGFLSIYNNFLIREYRHLAEGAISVDQHLPMVTPPLRYDQYWVVDHSDMTIEHANGLIGMAETKQVEKKSK